MALEPVLNHVDQAIDRLIISFKSKPKFEQLARSVMVGVQDLEEAFQQLLTERTVEEAIGFQLDRLGTILNVARNGLEDDEFRIVLVAKVATNVSNGTPEEMISILIILMRARFVELNEEYPASINFTAIGVDPIGDLDRIKESLRFAKPTGVKINQFILTRDPYFGFDGNPDPNCEGFADADDPERVEGGFWAEIF